ncbi:hypothetical protein EYC84_005955 [Monilinia fructicola]|uniref:Mur ligase central domain-containing protein n=1 Tax=Monilinia fructicola TaxID=38448 RepID=A0A5M9JZ47_MONFR|nr:hypothetical protein EYC84_005955 [Monilinia fructicola]
MIELGLSRISRLLRHTPQPWKAIHVAGTNGKGSICAYLSAMLSASGVRCGRFTSPHLIHRWDCITIDDRPVREPLFRKAEAPGKGWDHETRVPCVVDRSNIPSVREVISTHAKEIGSDLIISSTESAFLDEIKGQDLEPHQLENLACAYTAFHLAYTRVESPLHRLLPAIQDMHWPGRLQITDVSAVTGQKEPILLDGAHNVQSAEVLVTWVLAASQGKELDGIMKEILREGDCVAAVQFGPVDGMPWVQAMDTGDVLHAASLAATVAQGGPIVVAGSLYLVSDVLRLTSSAELMQCLLLD